MTECYLWMDTAWMTQKKCVDESGILQNNHYLKDRKMLQLKLRQVCNETKFRK